MASGHRQRDRQAIEGKTDLNTVGCASGCTARLALMNSGAPFKADAAPTPRHETPGTVTPKPAGAFQCVVAQPAASRRVHKGHQQQNPHPVITQPAQQSRTTATVNYKTTPPHIALPADRVPTMKIPVQHPRTPPNSGPRPCRAEHRALPTQRRGGHQINDMPPPHASDRHSARRQQAPAAGSAPHRAARYRVLFAAHGTPTRPGGERRNPSKRKGRDQSQIAKRT